jgi:hypothetical protein
VVQPSKNKFKGIGNKLKVEVFLPSKDKFKYIEKKLKVEVARLGKVEEVNRRACGNRPKT